MVESSRASQTAQVPPSQCPVPHAQSQPLPPGHPPVPSHPESSLRPPIGDRCIFFRTADESRPSTPDLTPSSRNSSVSKAEGLRAANVNPLKEGEGKILDPTTTLVLASRNSQLALVQSSLVSRMLEAHFGVHSPAFKRESSAVAEGPSSPSSSTSVLPHTDATAMSALRSRAAALNIDAPMAFPITSMSTAGDHNLRSPLYVIGGEGRAIWTKELEVALAAGAVDAIVHSLKDLPTLMPEGFMLGAVIEREDPRDALVIKNGLPYVTLDELPAGSVIGTSSIRRVAQLRRKYPGLVFSDVRGNLNTRLAKLDSPTGPYTALVLAAAGLIRINLAHRITAFLSSPVLLYSVGQGSLGVEVRRPPPGATPANNRDAKILEIIRSIGDWRSTARAEAERGLLRELEGGCSIPVGVESTFEDHQAIEGRRHESVVPLANDAEVGESGKAGHTITKAAVEATEAVVANGRNGHSNGSAGEGSGFKATALRNPALAREVESSAALADATGSPSSTAPRPSMERFATGANGKIPNGSSAANGAGQPTSSSRTGDATLTSPPSLSDSHFPALDPASILSLLQPASAYWKSTCSPPLRPLDLTLTAIVVSLDGARCSSFTLTRPISSVDEARELGVTVAKELRDVRGARAILHEVEVHRKRAEKADEERRMARKRRAEQLLDEENQAKVKAKAESAREDEADQEEGSKGFAADPLHSDRALPVNVAKGQQQQQQPQDLHHDSDDLSRRKLEEVLGAVTRKRDEEQQQQQQQQQQQPERLPLYPQEGGEEMDRRGVPREDGQEKVWEV